MWKRSYFGPRGGKPLTPTPDPPIVFSSDGMGLDYMFATSGTGSRDPNIHHWSYVAAEMLYPGNTVAVFSGSTITPQLIKDISKEISVGVFMPHTASGAIIVDDIVATELTTAVPSFLARSAFLHESEYFELAPFLPRKRED